MSIPKAMYEAVRQRAQHRCEYCLDLNDERRSDAFIQNARHQWLVAGLHPPNDDSRF